MWSQRLQKLHNIICANPNCPNTQILHHLPHHTCMDVKLAEESLHHITQWSGSPFQTFTSCWVVILGANNGVAKSDGGDVGGT